MQRRTLPACWVWATAVSAVEQKPHEGSFSQHENKHASDSAIIEQDDLCVLFGSGTVESAEEQDHWKAAHSFDLQGVSFTSWGKPKRRRVKVVSAFSFNLQVTGRFFLTLCSGVVDQV